MKTLSQNRLFDSRELKISETRLFYHDRRFNSHSIDLSIRFEEVTKMKVSHNKSELLVLALSLLSVLSAVACIFLGDGDSDFSPFTFIPFLLGGVAGTAYFFIVKENSWKIKVGPGAFVFIHKNIPDKESVDGFIETLFEARDMYLRESYLNFDKNLDYENQFQNLKWMMTNEVISKAEFDEKYQELKALYNFDKKSVGFGQ